MCGIVALYSSEGQIEQARVAQATGQLGHRGPDDRRQWISPDRHVGLGHTRLSVIDLAGGAQPISNEDGRLWITANGEFYDFERIRSGLEVRGHRFRTRSDTEIALHLYEDLGPKCLDHLRGEFAFIIWDQTDQVLFAARDRFGIKPLFYCRVGGTLYLGSEVRALFAAGVVPSWDRESVYRTLLFCLDPQQTLFKGVCQVPPGHYLLASRGSVRIVPYWDLEYPAAGAPTGGETEDEVVEHVRSLLDEAVRLRMRADVPVGCYLSGGIDSSSMLAVGSRHSHEAMAAFTIAFDHPDHDESSVARRQSELTGADFHRVAVSERECADVFIDVAGQGEMVHYNAHGAARWLLSRAVRQAGYKVVLAGEGADELFAGYGFLNPALQSSRWGSGMTSWLRVFRLIGRKSASEGAIHRFSPWLYRVSRMLAFGPSLSEALAEKFMLLESVMSQDFLREFQGRDVYREFIGQFQARGTLAGREPAKQLLYLWMKSMFVNYVLAAERLDMAHAVEVRLPFLDHKLFEYARSIPIARHQRNGTRKYLLREAVKPWVTPEVYGRVKQPFFAPAATLRLGNPLLELFQDLLRSETMASLPFFDRAAVVSALDRLPALDEGTRASLDPVIFALASLCVLQMRYRP